MHKKVRWVLYHFWVVNWYTETGPRKINSTSSSDTSVEYKTR